MSQDIVIDLTTYKDKRGSRIPEGRYRVVVEDAERDVSAAGNTMINVYLRVVEGEHRDATLVDRLTLTEKAMFRVVGFMQGLGLPTPRKRLVVNPRQFIGKVADVDVEDGDPYNGRIKSEVRGYLKVDGGGTAYVGEEAVDLEEPEDLVDEPEDLVDEAEAGEYEAEYGNDTLPAQEQADAEANDAEVEALAQRVAATKAAAAVPPKAPAAPRAAAAAKAPAVEANSSPWGGDAIDLDDIDL